jgi:iron complex outermembrane receptor protein
MAVRFLFFGAGLSLLAWSAPAQPADTTRTLPGVTVEAARVNTLRLPGRLTLLDATVLETTAATSLATLLETRSGASVRSYGDGALATASLRGTSSNQTLVLLDGLRLSDPQSGQVDLSLLPTLLLESVEILHGAASARYGADGIGGVIRLHTRAATPGVQVRAAGDVGAWGARRTGVMASGMQGRRGLLFAAETNRADGHFPYRNTTLFPARLVRREGAGYARHTLFGRLQWQTTPTKLSVAGWYGQSDRGLPGPGNAPPVGARQADTHLRLWAQMETRLAGGTLHTSSLLQHTHLHFTQPSVGTDERAHTRTAALETAWQRPVTPRLLLGMGLAAGHEAAVIDATVRQSRLGLFSHAVVEARRVLLYPALRMDAYASEGMTRTALSPGLGLNILLRSETALHLKANMGRAFRMPTFNERFWVPGGNPDLKPEQGWSADVGAAMQRSRLHVEASVFTARIQNQIAWHPSLARPGVQVWTATNVARVRTRGLEVSLSGTGRWFRAGLDYSYTRAEDRSTPGTAAFGHQLRYVPRSHLKAHASLGRASVGLDLSARLVGPRPLTSDGSQTLDPYQVLDAQLRWHHIWGRFHTTLQLGLDNTLDEAYSIIRFYPMPPRHLWVRLTGAFGTGAEGR